MYIFICCIPKLTVRQCVFRFRGQQRSGTFLVSEWLYWRRGTRDQEAVGASHRILRQMTLVLSQASQLSSSRTLACMTSLFLRMVASRFRAMVFESLCSLSDARSCRTPSRETGLLPAAPRFRHPNLDTLPVLATPPTSASSPPLLPKTLSGADSHPLSLTSRRSPSCPILLDRCESRECCNSALGVLINASFELADNRSRS